MLDMHIPGNGDIVEAVVLCQMLELDVVGACPSVNQSHLHFFAYIKCLSNCSDIF